MSKGQTTRRRQPTEFAANERAVVNLLVVGHAVSDVAERLGLTRGKVRYAEKVAQRRAGVRSREQLMRAHGNPDGCRPHAGRTPFDVQRAIASRREAGEKLEVLALDYGLSPSGVSRICTRAKVREANDEAARMLAEDAAKEVARGI